MKITLQDHVYESWGDNLCPPQTEELLETGSTKTPVPKERYFTWDDTADPPSVHIQWIILDHTNIYLKEEVKEVLSDAILETTCYNIANKLGLFLWNWKIRKHKPKLIRLRPTQESYFPAVYIFQTHWLYYPINALTTLTSLSTSFSSSLWYLNLGCGLLLLKSSSLKIRSNWSWIKML